jgi:hypothetical protein
MNRFSTADRAAPMTHTVSYERVPMFRGLAFALYHCGRHGADVDVFSADRRDTVIAEHNHQFGTSLSGQQHLVDLWRAGKGNPANSPTTTSHCLRSDGNKAYGGRPAGAELPWHMLGLDISDHGKVEDVSHFLEVARRLGYEVTQPYPSGSERHHVVFTASPIAVLERWDVIAKDRAGR